MKSKHFILGALLLTVWVVFNGIMEAVSWSLTKGAAVGQIEGGDGQFAMLRAFHDVVVVVNAWCLGLALFIFTVFAVRRCKAAGLFLLLLALTSGCKPYDKPEYAEIGNQETGFLISIEGSADQAKLPSEDYLASKRVADKRVQIVHRWDQQGRSAGDGAWIPTVRLIKVDRTPITRLWTREASVGTSAKNEAVSAETRDSVNFSAGFSCTAMVVESDATKFLYNYSAASLASVMDSEVLGRIQRQVQEIANRYSADEIRSRKAEIQSAVEADLRQFYAGRGITITNVAMYGGLTFENPGIQKAIDEAAIAQNLKVVEQGRLEAQSKTNQRLLAEADGAAAKAKREAEGLAAAKLIAAQAEADSVRKVNAALEEAKNNPLMLEFKRLEVEQRQIDRWNGALPQWQLGTAPAFIMGAPNAAK